MSLSFKKRIATHFMIATAIIIALVFGTVYFIVQKSVFQKLDADLSYEANKHISEIKVSDTEIHFINKNELEESEHREVQVNPVFLQLIGKNGDLMDKSPNLKENQLPFVDQSKFGDHFNSKLNNRVIRQIQIPIEKNGQLKGYIVAAMSLDGPLMVLRNLRNTIFILYPIVLLGLFFISSFLAGRSIIPVVSIIKTTNRITKKNLNERVELPHNNDELYDLSSSINSLLDRIENAIEREKQFTSDASHELRTPLSVLRGTLEVLIRKPRSQEEYEQKIKYSLVEIDRMANIIDQLLEIARFDANPELTEESSVSLRSLINQIIVRRSPESEAKGISVKVNEKKYESDITINSFYANLIIDNLYGNAIKYSHTNAEIVIDLYSNNETATCKITDFGIGINAEDLKKVSTPFFRSDALSHKEIKGFGLGLSIAQKAAKAINADINFESKLGEGTTVSINFKEILRKS